MKHRDLQRSAGTNYDDTGEYALTVWSEIGLTAEQIHERYLAHYPKARSSTAGRVRGVGYELKPTWDPGHYDIVLPNPPSVTDWDNLTSIFDTLIERPKGA
jgi:hypothetical protein